MVFDSGRGIEETFGFEGKTASGEGQRGNGGSDGEGSRRGNQSGKPRKSGMQSDHSLRTQVVVCSVRADDQRRRSEYEKFHGIAYGRMFGLAGTTVARRRSTEFSSFYGSKFYGAVREELRTPENQRFYPRPDNLEEMHALAMERQPDITLGGWGQDGHVAYNQARREPYSAITLDNLKNSRIRIQNNNWDTIIAMSQRSFGGAYQFVAPMSITYGLQECFYSKRYEFIRIRELGSRRL